MNPIISMLFVNWKTTLFGLLGAVAVSAAAFLQGQGGAWPYLAAILLALQGFVAKDHNVTGTVTPPAP